MKGKLPERKKKTITNQLEPNPNDPRTNMNQNTINQNESLIDNQPEIGVNYLQGQQGLIDNNNNNYHSDNYSFQNVQTRDLQRRMRIRHHADGAVSINVETEDLANENYDLYDNKDINFEKPKINENIGKERTEYYIESIRHDKYFKIIDENKQDDKMISKSSRITQEKVVSATTSTPMVKKAPVIKSKKPVSAAEIGRMQEDRIFSQFDDQLSEVITKTTTRVFLLFLFTQGLLAGMALLHLIFFFLIEDDLEFLKVYSKSARESFDVFHTLTFASLVGNGIKFISAFQRYRLISLYRTNSSMFTELRKNMIFSGILLVCKSINHII